jgi:hypothetical protein
MEIIALLIAFPLAIGFFVFALVGFKRFDAMVHRIYDTDKERWESLGRPMGYFWTPKEKTPFFRSTSSRDTLFFQFLAAGMTEKEWPNKPLHGTPAKSSSSSTEPEGRRP